MYTNIKFYSSFVRLFYKLKKSSVDFVKMQNLFQCVWGGIEILHFLEALSDTKADVFGCLLGLLILFCFHINEIIPI